MITSELLLSGLQTKYIVFEMSRFHSDGIVLPIHSTLLRMSGQSDSSSYAKDQAK